MDSFDIKLVLEEGPGVNKKFLSRKFILTPDYRNWMKYAQLQCINHRLTKPFEDECVVHIDWYRSRRIGDVDGRIKPIMDALEGYVYVNDKQVKRISCERFEDKLDPRYEIYIKII